MGVRDAANDAGYSTADVVEAAFAQVGLCPAYVPPAPVDLDIALDNTQLNWAVSGDGNWFGQTLTSYDGEDAAKSGEITHNQESALQTTLVRAQEPLPSAGKYPPRLAMTSSDSLLMVVNR